MTTPIFNKAFSDWYGSLPYGEPSYQETFEAGAAHARDVTELVEALEGLMHKDCGEPAFVKARTALSKYKGAK